MEVYVRFDIMRTEGMNRSADMVEEALMEECRNIGSLDVEDSMYEVEPELVEAPTESAARKELRELKKKEAERATDAKLAARDAGGLMGVAIDLGANRAKYDALPGDNANEKLKALLKRYLEDELVAH